MSGEPPDRRTPAHDPIEVRPAHPGEAELLAAFQLALARETEGLALDPATVSQGVRAVFDDPSKGEYLVAELDGRSGQPVGCLLVTREWSDWRNGSVLWVQSVYVVPEARGRGVYRALHRHLVRRIETAADLRGLRLYVERSNRAAQRVYERLGMSREHYELFEWMR